jgi:hypothetical protein
LIEALNSGDEEWIKGLLLNITTREVLDRL